MRSTVDLESVLDKKLRERARSLGISYKEALNRALLAGLHVLTDNPKRKRYVVRARACGLQPGVDHEKLGSIVDELEAEDYRAKNNRR
jgi:hypothetical protein